MASGAGHYKPSACPVAPFRAPPPRLPQTRAAAKTPRHMLTATPMPSDRTRPLAMPLVLQLPDLDATEALGRALARLLRCGDLLALNGDLGAGKTALARALIRALPGPAGAAEEEVPSPTFTLVQVYDREPAPVWHFDLYRIEDPDEIEELGLSEALAEGITLIEWPERLGRPLPPGSLSVTLAYAATAEGREARLEGDGDWPARLEEAGL